MSVIRTLTHEEFAAIRAKGEAYTHAFIKDRVKQIAAAKGVTQKAGLLRDEQAIAKIHEKIQNGDVDEMTTLLDRLETALLQQRETEDSIKKKAGYYFSDLEIADQASRSDPLGRLKMMSAHQASLHLTPKQRRRLDAHDQTVSPINLKLRRILRQNCKQATALLNMHLGLIGENGHHHATPHELQMRNDQKGRWREFGKLTILRRGDEEVSMLTVMQAASENKFNEILTLTKGIENYAKAAGLTWAFITLTAPPRMHSNPKNGHSTWDGTTPDMAHDWIADAEGRVIKRLYKKGIFISGLRVVESHKDGCPHWHLLVFAPLDQMPIIEAEFRWQPEWKSEAGLKFVLDDGRAKASSYLFKYLTKTINSVEQIAGEAGFVDAWRSTWGIRAFAFFGMPPVSLWRNLRTVKECPTEPLLAGLWRAAHRGDAHAFIGLNGGLNVARSDRPVASKTISDKNDKTKTIEFIIQETAESIKFDFVKWQQTRKEPQSRAGARVEVILNYPRRSKPTATATAQGRKKAESTFTDAPSACPTTRGEAGNDSLHLDEGGGSLIRGRPRPSSLPPPPPVGMARNRHGTGALVGALLDHPATWGKDIDLTKFNKFPSLADLQ